MQIPNMYSVGNPTQINYAILSLNISFSVLIFVSHRKRLLVIHPNNKPWVTKELKSFINKKKRSHFSGGPLEKKAVARGVRNEVRKAKLKYKETMERQYTGDLRQAWKGIKTMVSINQDRNECKQAVRVNVVEDSDLPNAFNSSRFERTEFSDISRLRIFVSENDMVISQECVATLLRKVKIRKAAGPDAICGCTLRYCADQLSGVFTNLFQRCFDSGQIPTVWKTSTIIPIPKVKNSRELKEFRPVALKSLVMKIFERIVKDMTLSMIDGKLDPLQFAYQAGKGVEDATLFILDCVTNTLRNPNPTPDFYSLTFPQHSTKCSLTF